VVLAHAGGMDWVLCQVTSNRYSDAAAIPLSTGAFADGGLGRESFARPGKLFTASQSIVVRRAGLLTPSAHREVVNGTLGVLRSGLRLRTSARRGPGGRRRHK
jgi:mRNA interferase MazF